MISRSGESSCNSFHTSGQQSLRTRSCWTLSRVAQCAWCACQRIKLQSTMTRCTYFKHTCLCLLQRNLEIAACTIMSLREHDCCEFANFDKKPKSACTQTTAICVNKKIHNMIDTHVTCNSKSAFSLLATVKTEVPLAYLLACVSN